VSALDEDPVDFPRLWQIAKDTKEVTVGEGRRLAKEVIDLRARIEGYKTHDASWKAREENAHATIKELRQHLEEIRVDRDAWRNHVIRVQRAASDAIRERGGCPR
jgi:hypothetical protein